MQSQTDAETNESYYLLSDITKHRHFTSGNSVLPLKHGKKPKYDTYSKFSSNF